MRKEIERIRVGGIEIEVNWKEQTVIDSRDLDLPPHYDNGHRRLCAWTTHRGECNCHEVDY